jgi:hypothetical protein
MSDRPRWLLSQHKDQFRPGDEKLPPVRSAAKIEALHLIGMLEEASTIGANGEIVISNWSLHRVALRLAEIAEHGLEIH